MKIIELEIDERAAMQLELLQAAFPGLSSAAEIFLAGIALLERARKAINKKHALGIIDPSGPAVIAEIDLSRLLFDEDEFGGFISG